MEAPDEAADDAVPPSIVFAVSDPVGAGLADARPRGWAFDCESGEVVPIPKRLLLVRGGTVPVAFCEVTARLEGMARMISAVTAAAAKIRFRIFAFAIAVRTNRRPCIIPATFLTGGFSACRVPVLPTYVGRFQGEVVVEPGSCSARSSRSAAANSEPRWKRSAGSFAIARVSTPSRERGNSRSNELAGIGSRFTTLKQTVVALFPVKGECPVTIE